MKKWLLRLLAGFSLLLVFWVIMVYSWTYTPAGRLNVRSALMLKIGQLVGSDGPLPPTFTPAIRQEVDQGTRQLLGDPYPFPAWVDSSRWPGPQGPIPVRIYRPGTPGPLPLILYAHGGGWVVGTLDQADNICRYLAAKLSAVVVSVAYRLAPEHPFPQGLDDLEAAYQYARQQADSLGIDSSRIAGGGDSSGANLVAALNLRLHAARQPLPAANFLYYPITQVASLQTPSFQTYGEGYGLTTTLIDRVRRTYTTTAAEWQLPEVSPLLADSLYMAPPTLVINAEFDPLKDDGQQYAARLQRAGVPVRREVFPGMLHGFISNDRFFQPEAEQALDLTLSWLREQGF